MNNKSDAKLKALSVLVAIFMWTFVVNSTDPTTSKTFRNIPVVIKNQDDLEKSGYTIVGKEESYQTSVKLKGSREKLVSLKPANIYASVDISDLKTGVQSLDIEVDTPSGISVDEVDPGQINLNIQEVVEKALPVNLVISDNIKDGKIVEVNELTPERITVKGPASLINKVDRAELKVDDPNLLDGNIHSLPVKILDKEGKVISDLSISHDDVNVSFLVYETKQVNVVMKTDGNIDKDYKEVSREVSPDSIIIKGPESVLKDIEAIYTLPVDINNQRTSKNGEVKLDLPESVKVYNGEDLVNYKINIEKKSKADDEKNDK
ncbi:YbbR-like domain-containing protein [Anaerococcus sp.]|uniref:CdaR family protein n=1 Tax=Anaerococcus sp. TaxID=1872515 RepID=UPI0028FFFDD9|nr:CdaR family protein [Anaerococcus sp.]MDU2599239.1 CdaR family protein [Anaerococcus sp.]